MSMTTEAYGYSLDGETFHGRFATRAIAIAAGGAAALETRDLRPGAKFQTGRHDNPAHAREFIPDIDDILEHMTQKASDDYDAEDWPDIGKEGAAEEQQALSIALQNFADAIQRVDPPTFHYIVDEQTHVVPEA